MSVPITITTAGLAALVNASRNGSAQIAIAAIGVSSAVVSADPALTALPGEIKRLTTISGTVVTAATIHIGMEDDSTDAYSMNSFGLYLGDGTLFAVYGQASAIYVKSAGSIGLLACDIAFTAGSATAVSFGASGFLNPPASTTVMGVVELATLAQAEAGTEAAAVLTPATAAGAFATWLAAANELAGFTFVSDVNGNWKETRPNGVIEMGGVAPAGFSAEQSAVLTFPFGGFPNHCWDFSATIIDSTASVTGVTIVQEVALTKAAATYLVQDQSSTFGDANGGFRWRARGA